MKTKSTLLMALALSAAATLLNAQDQEAPRRPGGPPRDGEPRGEFRGPPDGERGEFRGPRDGERPPGGPRDGERGPGGPRMRPPIMAALDADNDGVIDKAELKNATAALTKLDRNGDGKLTMEELMPPRPEGGPGFGRPEGRRPEGGEGFDGPRRPRGDGPAPEGERPARPQRPPQEQ